MKFQTINNIEFTSVSSLTNYTRTLLKQLGICESIKNTNMNTFNFLFELIKNHPSYDEKIEDFQDFSVTINDKNKKALELNIIKSDGTFDVISWLCCCSGKPRSYKDLFNKCLRNIIKQQIFEYKNKHNTNICELCKKHNNNIHIDHYKITFKELVHNFMIKYKLNIPTAFEKDENNNVVLLGDDILIGEYFEKYHKENATFRILCAKCNLSRCKDGTDVEIYDIVEKQDLKNPVRKELFYLKEYVIDLD